MVGVCDEKALVMSRRADIGEEAPGKSEEKLEQEAYRQRCELAVNNRSVSSQSAEMAANGAGSVRGSVSEAIKSI